MPPIALHPSVQRSDRLTKKWRSEAEVCGFDVPPDLEDELDEGSSD